MERQVSSGWSPYVKEQSRSRDIVLWRQGRIYEKERKLQHMVEVGVSIQTRFEAMEAEDEHPGLNGHDEGGK